MRTVPLVLALGLGLVLALPLGACKGSGGGGNGGNGDDARPPASDGPMVEPTCDAPSSSTELALEEVASGLTRPIFVTAAPGDPRLFVIEQPGRIRIIEGDQVTGTFLDITDPVRSNGNEQGLLGLAFHPNYPTDNRFFVNYTAEEDPGEPVSMRGKTVVAEYRVSSDPGRADPDSEVRLLVIPQVNGGGCTPCGNHNGGMVAFGPDGLLYVGVGDGGSGNDPANNAQNNQNLLGTLLRIDVSTPGSYAIPPDNPFASGGGAPEIWAYGLRNPWRFSFDRETGDLYIGDVGQNAVEEINYLPAGAPGGANFGWKLCEGSAPRPGESSSPDCTGGDLVPPISGYGPKTGGRECRPDVNTASVSGGYVYRGSCLTAFQGHYFFADYCHDQVWHFAYEGSPVNDPPEITFSGARSSGLASFGEDAAGELYIASRDDGRVFRIVAR